MMSNGKIITTINNAKSTIDNILDDDVGLYLANQWALYFAKYVPTQEGILATNLTIEPYQITYNSPYAHYQWEGKLYVDPITGKGAFYDTNYGFWSRPGVTKIPTDIPLNYSKEQNPLATSHWEVPANEAFNSVVADSITKYLKKRR